MHIEESNYILYRCAILSAIKYLIHKIEFRDASHHVCLLMMTCAHFIFTFKDFILINTCVIIPSDVMETFY